MDSGKVNNIGKFIKMAKKLKCNKNKKITIDYELLHI